LLAFGAVAVTVLCSVIFLVQTRANIEASIFADQSTLGEAYARVVQENLDGSRAVLEGLARMPAIRAPFHPEFVDPELYGIPTNVDVERRASAAGMIEGSRRVTSVVAAWPNGDIYMWEPFAKQTGARLRTLSFPEITQRTRETQQTTWSHVIVDAFTGQPTVVIQVPVKDDSGQMISILGSSLNLVGLTDTARTIQPGTSRSVMLFDGLGMPVVYPDASRVAAREPLTDMPLVSKALNGETGSFTYYNPLTKTDELGTSVALNNGWFTMVTETQAEAFASLTQTTATLLAVLGVSVVVLLGAGVLLARSIAGGLASVARAATGLAAGDLEQEVDVRSSDELGRMTAAFRDMIAYHQRMAAIADAVAAGDMRAEVQPQSSRDRLGIALHGMIAKRRRVEQQLRIGNRAMAASPTAIAICDLELVVYVNPAFERLTGYAAADIVSHQMGVLAGPETVSVELEEIQAAFREEREAAVSIVCYRQDGTTFWSDLTLAPVRDGDGPTSHFVVVISDISERKQAEKQAEALARTEKLRALGQMASGIAHDLNQSLMLIASYGALGQRALDQEPPDRDELRELFTVVTQAAMDSGATVKRLLLLARAPLQGTEPIDVSLLVQEVVQLTAPRWRDAAQGEGRPIHVDVETLGHPIVVGSSGALRDALMNVILNAVDALPTGGTIHVRSAQRHDQVGIEITDDGIGMSPEVQAKIFEPFFTTKGDKGTGLGLATVFGIVERHGGQVRVHSALGKGTKFRLTLPTSNLPIEVEASTGADVIDSAVEQRQLRILAVDDEPSLTKAVVRLLRPGGHLVTTAISGEEALEYLEKQAFDLVLSDVGMGPGMSGWDLAERVRTGWPDIRFVLATGWGAGIDPVEARDKGVAAVLAKPYSFEELKMVLAAA
jgi:PAS domain S-box-containing protein